MRWCPHPRPRGSGHADESADVVASFHLAQVGDVGTGSAVTPSAKLLAVLVEIAPRSGRRPQRPIVAAGVAGAVREVSSPAAVIFMPLR